MEKCLYGMDYFIHPSYISLAIHFKIIFIYADIWNPYFSILTFKLLVPEENALARIHIVETL